MQSTCHPSWWLGLGLGVLTACGRIAIAPSCPTEITISETAEIRANVSSAGAVPSYVWEVIPSTAGTLADASMSTTTFRAIETGEVVFRLTASDGLFQAVGECHTLVSPASDPPPTDGDDTDNGRR